MKKTYSLIIVVRYLKDIKYYQKELEGQQAKLSDLQSKPDTCPHVLKKHLEGIAETEAMLPDCQERLKRARDDLEDFLTAAEGVDKESSIFTEAQSFISQ